LITTLSHTSGHTESATDRCWATSMGSWSLTVVPSSTLPDREIVPVAASNASTRVVFPAPEWPTRATLRIFSGRSAGSNRAVALFVAAFLFDIGHHSSSPSSYTEAYLRVPAFDTQAWAPDKQSGQIGPGDVTDRPGIVGAHTLPRNGYLDSVLNIHARGFFSRAVAPLAAGLVKAGITPDVITVIGTVGAVAGALVFFPNGWWFAGTLIIWAFVMLDLVDGAVARAGGRGTAFGAVLDSSCDRVADAAIFGAIGWYYAQHGQRWMLLAALLCLVLGSLTSYIRARAEAAGLTATVGIAERADRLVIVLVGTGLNGLPGLHVPYVLAVALWGLVAASTITVYQRFATVWTQSRARAAVDV
jgi:CDP-diacylglycerol--glycerol-3-phosphate 3-phosphatidyltransferase